MLYFEPELSKELEDFEEPDLNSSKLIGIKEYNNNKNDQSKSMIQNTEKIR